MTLHHSPLEAQQSMRLIECARSKSMSTCRRRRHNRGHNGISHYCCKAECSCSSIIHLADCGRIAMNMCWTCNMTSDIGVHVSVQDWEDWCKHDSRCAGGTHLYSALCQTVQTACSLIQQQYPRVLQDGPGKCHPLLLTCHIAAASAKLV